MGRINDYTDALIEKYSLRDYVDCIGNFPYLEAVKKMQNFDCLVLLEAKLEKGVFCGSIKRGIKSLYEAWLSGGGSHQDVPDGHPI